MTTTNVYNFRIDSSKLYVSLLREIYRKLKGMPDKIADIETLINCTQAMLCAKRSRDEANGAWVHVDELNENDRFDGYAFEKEYGEKAGEVYKG